MYFLRVPLLFAIRVYQKTLSPDHGPLSHFFEDGYCRFYPSCSEYGYLAIKRYGIIKGVALSSWRIMRCNPWSAGGIDEVPTKKKSCSHKSTTQS